jgi:Xaa-Pro aminopeptidase
MTHRQVELEGMRQCHIRDGAALVSDSSIRSIRSNDFSVRQARYFAWLEEQLHAGVKLTEFEAAERLEAYRRCVLPRIPGQSLLTRFTW